MDDPNPATTSNPPPALTSGRAPVTSAVTRGVARLLHHQGCAVLHEVKLANRRRADLMALSPKGVVTIVEIKSCQADFDVDEKWEEYLEFCDHFFFGVAEDFPQPVLPDEEGLIIADRFGAGIVREGPARPLNAARRKAVTLRFARQAAFAATGLRQPADFFGAHRR
ncbi:MAG: MmcB family DNA repair protein [Pseudomonadota bacterium]